MSKKTSVLYPLKCVCTCAPVCLCLLLLQSISISLLQLQAFMLRLSAEVNLHFAYVSQSCDNCDSKFKLFVSVCRIPLAFPSLPLTPSGWISPHPPPLPLCLRGEVEFGRERVGGHTCHHGSFETLLSRASRAPRAVRLLHRHCGDSQWVTSFSPGLFIL